MDATTGGIKSGVTYTVRRCIDGTFAAGGGTVTEDSTNGWYKYAMSQGDTNGNNIAFNFTGTGAVPQTVNIITTAGDPTDSVRFGLTALPNAAAEASGGLYTRGTGAGQINQDANGRIDANVKTWISGTIPAVNVTGVPLVDAKYLLGTIFSTPATAGIIDVNLKNIANATVSASSAQLGVNVVQVGAVAQTGGDIYPAVTNIGVTSAALNKVADSRTITTGSGEANTYTSTAAADGTYHSISDSAGSIDFYYEATLPTTGGALTGVNWLGYVVGVVNTIKVYIYNWTNSGWDQVGSVVGIAGTVAMDVDFDATNDHTGTGGNALKVRFRFSATGLTSATVKTDRLLFGYAVVPNTTTPPTAAAIATQIWTDTTASDFTTALSVGKSLMNGVTLGTGLTVNALTTNNDKTGYSLNVTPPTSAAIATAIWTDLLASSDFSTALSIGKLLKDDIDTTISSRLATSGYTAPSNLTAAQIATGVWTDTTAGDFTTALSIGKSVMNGVSLGTGLTINAYTGNTVQTGDSFARIGVAGAGLTNLGDARIANLDTTVSSRGTSILTQTQVTGGAYSVQSSSCVLGDARIANLDAAVSTRSTLAVGAAMTLTTAYDFAKGTVAMTESYAADGAAPTPAQALFAIQQFQQEKAISSTTMLVKKLDGSTTAMTFTLDSASAPTTVTRSG